MSSAYKVTFKAVWTGEYTVAMKAVDAEKGPPSHADIYGILEEAVGTEPAFVLNTSVDIDILDVEDCGDVDIEDVRKSLP